MVQIREKDDTSFTPTEQRLNLNSIHPATTLESSHEFHFYALLATNLLSAQHSQQVSFGRTYAVVEYTDEYIWTCDAS